MESLNAISRGCGGSKEETLYILCLHFIRSRRATPGRSRSKFIESPESPTIVTWHESNAFVDVAPALSPPCAPCPPHNSLSVHKLEPNGNRIASLTVRIGRTATEISGFLSHAAARARICCNTGW